MAFKFKFLQNRVSASERAFVVRQLATMLASGLPIDRAVSALATHIKNEYLSGVFRQIESDLEAGLMFSKAISKHPKVFNQVFVNVVMAGEAVGKVAEVLNQMATQLESENDFMSKIWGALYYPIVILVGIFGVGIVMIVKVVPQFKEVFAQAGSELPLTTRILVGISDFMSQQWWLFLLILAAIIYGIKLFFSSEKGKVFIDYVAIHLPVPLILDFYMARFSRTLALLSQSGTPIIEALAITAQVVGNRYYAAVLLQARDEVSRGIPLSMPLSKSTLFPTIVPQMVMVGEQTGRLDQIMNNLAIYYEQETSNQLKTISSLFEPAMLIIVGLGVAFIVFAIFVPIYSMAQIT